MLKSAFSKTLLVASVLLLIVTIEVRAQEASNQTHKLSASAPVSDVQIIKDLTATDEDKASRAVSEIMQRGARMIPLLMKLKGNRQCFFGDQTLGSHAGCSMRFMPKKSSQCYEQSSSSTLEVAALFLIEAIYHNNLEFAQGATLAEWEASGEERTGIKHNGHELIARAWATVEQWYKELDRDGLETLRLKDRAPFSMTRLGFY